MKDERCVLSRPGLTHFGPWKGRCLVNQRKVLRYSEAFKRHVVGELESGSLTSATEACRRYGVANPVTVARWVRQYGRNDLLARYVRVEKPGERDQLKLMEKRIRDLEHALAQTQMKALLNEGYFSVLCEQTGLDPEEQKKKLRGTLSTRPSHSEAEGEVSR